MTDTVDNISVFFEGLAKEMEELKKIVSDRGKEIFKEGVSSIFTEYPNLRSFSWQQYTPYFNDGEECVFRVHSDYVDIKFKDGRSPANNIPVHEGEMEYYITDGDITREDVPMLIKIGQLINAVPSNIMKDIFGDHTEITCYDDGGFQVEHYEHE